MTRRQFIVRLREHVPPERWERTWVLAPAVPLLLIPIGVTAIVIAGWLLNWYGMARAAQGVILLAIVSGPIVGSIVLWSIDEAGLDRQSYHWSVWLARIAIPGPLLTILVTFWLGRLLFGA